MDSPAAPSTKIAVKAPAPGDVIAGKYSVERVLGRGAMGVVVAARHQQLDQVVAIKLLAPDALQDGVAVERFLREARAAVRLRSEHVARILDVGQLETGLPFMVMEHLEGADLGEVLDRAGPLDPAEACEYVVQACDAVAEAHARGIVHRDLKPENLYLTTRVGGAAMVKVLDFGISKVMTDRQGALTQTRAVVGSPLYMAPEQLRSSKNASPRSDVWSLGVVLYELLTRRWPFEADTLPDLCIKVARESPRPVSQHRGDLPSELEDVIARCLEKDPERRYSDAASLALALEPFLRSAAPPVIGEVGAVARSLAETQAPAVPGPAAHRRRPRRAGVGLTLLVIVATAGAFTVEASRASPAEVSLAAVEAALQSSDLARVPKAAETPPEEAPAVSPAASPVASTALSQLSRSHGLRPARAAQLDARPAARVAPVASAPVDDIPAFR